MGPGLRRESVLVALSCTAGRELRWGTNKRLDLIDGLLYTLPQSLSVDFFKSYLEWLSVP
jgi:hypothetical protein